MVETGKNSKGFCTRLLGPIDLNVAMLQISGWIMLKCYLTSAFSRSFSNTKRVCIMQTDATPQNPPIAPFWTPSQRFSSQFFRCYLIFAGCNRICLSKCLEDHSTSRTDSAGCSFCKQRSVPFDSTRSPHGAWKKYETGQNMSKDASRQARRCLNLTSRIFT